MQVSRFATQWGSFIILLNNIYSPSAHTPSFFETTPQPEANEQTPKLYDVFG